MASTSNTTLMRKASDTTLDSFHCAFQDLTFLDRDFVFRDYNCFLSAPFSADDDGKVFFRIGLEVVEYDRDMFAYGQVGQVSLFLEEKPSSITVDIKGLKVRGRPLYSKANYEKFGLGVPRGKVKFESGLHFSVHRKIRVTLTYLKVVSKRGQGTGLRTKRSLTDHVASLLQNPIASDVILRANGKKYKLHKCILAARSEVFEAMFNIDMKEKNEGIVNIADVSSDALEMMIKFIYNDDVVIMDAINIDSLEELFFLADKYNIATLKEKCEVHLIAKLDAINCVRLFNAATNLNARHLQTAAKDVMSSNLNWLLGSGAAVGREFQQFIKHNHDVFVQVTTEAVATKFL